MHLRTQNGTTEQKTMKVQTEIEHTMSYIFSSDPDNGALNITDDGSRFTVQLNRPIAVPREARNCTLEMSQASIWYTSPNISVADGNNMFYFIVSATPESFLIPNGLYSIEALNSLISRETVNLGYNADQIVLTADPATNKSVFTFPYVDTQVDFRVVTATDTTRLLLGFDARLVPVAPSTVGQSDTGDTEANLNTLNSWLVHSNLVSAGIPVNATGQNIIARVPITVSVGKQENFLPTQPVTTSISELVGNSINSFDVWITNEVGDKIDTAGEFFDIVVIIRYHL